jgi:hypothetical protein
VTTTTGPGTGWVELAAQGATTSFSASQPGPDGHGFIYDTGALSGKQINAGTWAITQLLKTNGNTITGDMVIRVQRLGADGVFTPIVTAETDEVTIGSINTLLPTPSVSGPAICFGSGDRLYYDVLVNVAGGMIAADGGLKINENASSATLHTPGYSTCSPSTPKSLTVYGTTKDASGPPGANKASATAPSGPMAVTTTTGPGTGWVELSARARTASFATNQPAPDGHGFVYDTGALSGQQIDAGTWSLAQQIKTTSGTVTADVAIRIYRLGTDAFYTPIVTARADGVSIGATNTLVSPAAVTGQAVCFGTGGRLYYEVLVHVVSGTIAAGGGLKINENASSARLHTPGYRECATPSPTPSGT